MTNDSVAESSHFSMMSSWFTEKHRCSSLPRSARSSLPAATCTTRGGSSGVCVCVCARARVSARAVACPAQTLPRARPAGAPFATGLLASLPRRVDVVLPSGPSRVHSCDGGHRTCSRLDSWARPVHSWLSSGKSLCSSCGAFSVTACQQFFKGIE